MDKLREKREIERSEALDKTAKIISSLIPGGASVYETYRALVMPLHEQKANEWQRDVIKRLAKLESDKKINLTELQSNEDFNTIITRATVLTLQNHEAEKLEAFRNITIKNALGEDLNFDLQMIFLRLVDELTVTHIQILNFLDNPKKWYETSIRSPNSQSLGIVLIIQNAFPSLLHEKELVKQLINELQTAGLLKTMSLRVIVKGEDNLVSRTTKLGKDFINFIGDYQKSVG